MPAVGVRIDGIKEVRKALRDLDAGTDEHLHKTGRAAETSLVTAGRREVPRRTGTLASSLVGIGQGPWPEVQAGTKGSVAYAGPIHFGWPTRGLHRASQADFDRVVSHIQGGGGTSFGMKSVTKIRRRRESTRRRTALARGGPIKPNPFLYRAADQRAGDIASSYQEALEQLTRAALES